MEIRELSVNEYDAALELAWRTFCEYEAPDYSQEGVDAFYAAIHDPEYISQLRMYGAYEIGNLMGVLATRSAGAHIALFFVDGRFQRRGVGRALFGFLCAQSASERLTVNSSPYAVEVYQHLGFRALDAEQVRDGMRYTPMECVLKASVCPCKRKRCKRHGNCAACREHHKTKKLCVACERDM